MLKMLVSLIIVAMTASISNASGFSIESLSAVEQEDTFSANLTFGSQVSNIEPKVEFINETIQIDIPNASVKDGKILKKVDGDKVKSLLAYQLNKNTARFRMILQKGIKAEKFREAVATESTGNGFRVNIKDQAKADELSGASVLVKNAPRELNSDTSTEETVNIDETKIEAELTSLAKSKSSTSSEPKIAAAKNVDEKVLSAKPVEPKQVSESEIPVLSTTQEKKTKAAGVSGLRLTLGLTVVALFLFGMWVASQRWLSKKNLKNSHTNIRVLTQHHLGPKKSLAIISVAGESILIGVTDQNISLIKTLSLLDEEIPQDVSNNFQQSLVSAEKVNEEAAEGIEDHAMKGVKDIVSDRLKGMRNLW